MTQLAWPRPPSTYAAALRAGHLAAGRKVLRLALGALLVATFALASPGAHAQRAADGEIASWSRSGGGPGAAHGRLLETSTGPYEAGATFEVLLQLWGENAQANLGTSTLVIDFNEHALSYPAEPAPGTDYEFINFNCTLSTAAECPTPGNDVAVYQDGNNRPEVRLSTSSVRVTMFIQLLTSGDGLGQALGTTPTDVALIRFTVVDPAEGLALAFRSQQLYDGPGGPEGAFTTGDFTGLARAEQEIAGTAGWRMLSAPAAGLTVADLADQNLVQGVDGQYPEGDDNLYADYSGSAWIPAAMEGDALDVGEGFIWYHFDETFDPDLPSGTSQSLALPYTLGHSGPPAAGLHPGLGLEIAPAEVSVGLHATGDGWNLVGNPLPYAFDLSHMTAPSGDFQTTAEIWDANIGSYVLSTDPAVDGIVAPWQGFFIQNDLGGTPASSLRFDIAGQASGGTFLREDTRYRHTASTWDNRGDGASEAKRQAWQGIAFTLAGTDHASGVQTFDQAIQLYLSSEASSTWDRLDAEKLTPLQGTYATLAFVAERDGAEVLLAQDARPPSGEVGEAGYVLPLAFEAAGIDGTFTLQWPSFDVPEEWPVVLTDLATGTETDLREASSYTFEASAGRLAHAEPVAFAAVPMQRLDEARFVLYAGMLPTTSDEDASTLPAAFSLDGNYPNPFTAAAGTRIRYALPETATVTLAVYDVLGRRVTVLIDAEEQAAGYHEVPFRPSHLASGVYLVSMEAADRRFVSRITLVR